VFTFLVEQLLLCRLLFVDTVELEAEFFGEVLRIWYLDSGGNPVRSIMARNDLVLFDLRLQKRSNARNDSDAHLEVSMWL